MSVLLRLVKLSSTAAAATTSAAALHRQTVIRHYSRELTTIYNSPKKPDNDDAWNDAWETAWLPEDKDKDANANANAIEPEAIFENTLPPLPPTSDLDPDTTAFVSDMNENWETRRNRNQRRRIENDKDKDNVDDDDGDDETTKDKEDGLYCLENIKKDYRLKKQRIHAALWVKEIEKLHEAKLGVSGDTDDIDKLLDSCSEIFDSSSNDVNNPRVPSTSEFKNKPDGWESLIKSEDGTSVWEMTQRDEDILLQEFERRLAFCKFQIASFIKSHIFSRRRPVDGWKHMIEFIGPNANRSQGSAPRSQGLADPATQGFAQEREPMNAGRITSPNYR